MRFVSGLIIFSWTKTGELCYYFPMAKEFLKKNEIKLALVIILLGALLRLAGLDSLPLGFNQDEASAGYDAWAILNYGIDRNGNSLPLLLEAWGSGQNALYSYISMPFIAVFGLSVWSFRLPGALVGVATLAVFWLFARKCRGSLFGLAALLFLALNPWHIMASRWALESNLLPFFLLLGVYLTAVSSEKPWALVGAAASLGLSLYAYGTAFFFLPLYLILAVLWLYGGKALRPKSFLTALAVFIIIALPITLCQLVNVISPGKNMSILGFTLPALTEGRQMATSVFGGGGLSSAFDNFGALLRILWKQSDGLPYNAVSPGGIFYIFGLPLFILGLIFAIKERKTSNCELPMLIALCSAFLCSFLIEVNINRINMIWLPIIYFSSLGFYFVTKKLKAYGIIPPVLLLVCFAMFFSSYVKTFKTGGYPGYFPGLEESIEYAETLDTLSVFVTDTVNQPYIFVLFYTQTPPQEFIDTVDYINPGGAFEHVRSFGKYLFGSAENAQGDVLILHKNEASGRTILAEFGHYAVCK